MKGIQAIVEVSISGNYLGEPLPHSESAAALVAPEVSSLALGSLPRSYVYGVSNFRASMFVIHSLVCKRHFLFFTHHSKRSIRNRPKHGVEEGSPEPSPEDHPPFADDPNSEGYYHYPRTSARHCTCVVNNTSGSIHLHPSSPQPVTQQA